MQLLNLHATPHAAGHRIDLTWTRPASPTHPGVRIVRRRGTYPLLPDDGVVVKTVAPGSTEGETDEAGQTVYAHADDGLQGGEIYYYAFFPFAGDPPSYAFDPANRASALAGAHYDAAGQMRDLLPALYHRYDDAQGSPGPLHRLLALLGGELDLLRTEAASLLDLYNVDRVDGALLPLLAQWMGWRSDFRRTVAAQRSEIRFAPELYRRVGLVPTVEATVKRISTWESRTKEFVHNIARTNTPQRLTLWRQLLDATGAALPVPEAEEAIDPRLNLLSVDEAHHGRPSVVTGPHGIRWMVYHTRRKQAWQIWHKTSPAFDVGRDVEEALPSGGGPGTVPDALQDAFLAAGYALDGGATLSAAVPGQLWQIDDAANSETYVLEATPRGAWRAYHTSASPVEWAASQPLAADDDVLKNPVIVRQGGALWVFWEVWTGERWHLRYCRRADAAWSEIHTLRHPHVSTEAIPERRSPAALVDSSGQLWLFWKERASTGWHLVYNVHDGSTADGALDDAGWAEAAPVAMPPDGGAAPRADDDLFVVPSTPAGDPPLWVGWARLESVPAVHEGATRWRVVMRPKTNLTPSDAASWEAVQVLPGTDPAVNDREPSAVPQTDGSLLVVWSTTRDGSWSVWRSTLERAGEDAVTWGTPSPITDPPFDHRAPLLVDADPSDPSSNLLLLTRTNRSLRYDSELYGATATHDPRYSGTQTLRVTNAVRIAQRGALRDLQTYTYDTGPPEGRTDADWYARDTIGLYVEPDTVDPDALTRRVDRLRRVLPEFMPVTDRAVVILPSTDVSPPPHTDYIYRYDAPPDADVGIVGSTHADTLTTVTTEGVPSPSETESVSIVAASESSVPAPTDTFADSVTSEGVIVATTDEVVPPPTDDFTDTISS